MDKRIRTNYARDYYRKNKDRLNVLRRKRYKENPRYGELQKIRADNFYKLHPEYSNRSWDKNKRRDKYQSNEEYREREKYRSKLYREFKKLRIKISDIGDKCTFCGKNNNQEKLSIDHIIPLSKGGNNDITNLQILCIRCNSSKKDKL